jgi:ATP-dependent Lon protease
MFITTANILDPIPPALRDRMEVIEFPGYIEQEKLTIAHKFLIPRQFEAHGLKPEQVQFSEPALRTMIREYTFEAGVRNFERAIANVCRKVARRVAENRRAPQRITPGMLNKLLGPPQFTEWLANEVDDIGVANGLAWTEAGGDVMQVEVALISGKGSLTLTGQLGEVMQESAQAALTYARAHAEEFGFADLDFDKIDLHIHVPEGGIPKDGPSAGVTLAAALISALTERPIRHDIAMTGEITLRGRVLPIGGLKEKLMAAHRMRLKTVFFPQRNQKDLIDVPRNIQRDLELVPVDHMDEILSHALMAELPETARPRRRHIKRPTDEAQKQDEPSLADEAAAQEA